MMSSFKMAMGRYQTGSGTRTRTPRRQNFTGRVTRTAQGCKNASIPVPARVNFTRRVTRTREHTRELHINMRHSHAKINLPSLQQVTN
jgi:hypothetical protein